jgi:hypothetical protein
VPEGTSTETPMLTLTLIALATALGIAEAVHHHANYKC